MNLFKLRVISDSEILFSGKVRYCGITTVSGSIGFEANHEPFLGILKPGSSIEYTDRNGTKNNIPIEDGMFKFTDNSCSVIVSL